MSDWFVRTPASSANLGAGFDVLGLALDLFADLGLGAPPDDARSVDEHHPARIAFERAGGAGPVWMRCDIPMGRGLGFSGAARVGGAALAVVQAANGDPAAIRAEHRRILDVAATLEGHGDNVAASLHGGVTAYVDGSVVSLRVGPVIGAAVFVAWVPDVTTSTDSSRRALGPTVALADAVHNIGRAVQFVAAIEHDDPDLLRRAAEDRLHQGVRLPGVPGAADALEAGLAAGAWAGWLSGSGPTVGLLCDRRAASAVVAALDDGGGHVKVLGLDIAGARVELAS